jgi:hypothetical protein
MGMNWEPPMTTPKLESLMEATEVSESDRDEIRGFAEILRRRKCRQEGSEVAPASIEMMQFILGDDA